MAPKFNGLPWGFAAGEEADALAFHTASRAGDSDDQTLPTPIELGLAVQLPCELAHQTRPEPGLQRRGDGRSVLLLPSDHEDAVISAPPIHAHCPRRGGQRSVFHRV